MSILQEVQMFRSQKGTLRACACCRETYPMSMLQLVTGGKLVCRDCSKNNVITDENIVADDGDTRITKMIFEKGGSK